MIGKLSSIYICKKKGAITESISQAFLNEKYGLIGDYKSESSDRNRQLSILLCKDRENIDKNYRNIGLCTRRFKENILIEYFDSSQLSPHTRLKVGESKIEITSVGKKCFKECEIVINKEFCPLKEGTLFAKVVEDGIIKVGDTVVKEKEE